MTASLQAIFYQVMCIDLSGVIIPYASTLATWVTNDIRTQRPSPLDCLQIDKSTELVQGWPYQWPVLTIRCGSALAYPSAPIAAEQALPALNEFLQMRYSRETACRPAVAVALMDPVVQFREKGKGKWPSSSNSEMERCVIGVDVDMYPFHK